jgi:hypothetical protein
MFWKNISLHQGDPDDGGDTFLRNIGSYMSHCVTSLKTAFFIATAMKTSNLTM